MQKFQKLVLENNRIFLLEGKEKHRVGEYQSLCFKKGRGWERWKKGNESEKTVIVQMTTYLCVFKKCEINATELDHAVIYDKRIANNEQQIS